MKILSQAQQYPGRIAAVIDAEQKSLRDKFQHALDTNGPIDDEMRAHLEWLNSLVRAHGEEFGRTAGLGEEVMRYLQDHPQGITFKHRPGDGPTSGYMVSTPDAEQIQDFADLTPQDIEDYYYAHPQIADDDTDDFYGGWHQKREDESGADWYHDVSRNIEDSYDAAGTAARDRQLAVFDAGLPLRRNGDPLPQAMIDTGEFVSSGPASALGFTHSMKRKRAR